jgi:hypothetical protein
MSQKVAIRPFTSDDVPNLQQLANNANISRNLSDAFPHPYTLAYAREFVERATAATPTTLFAITYNDTYRGNAGLHPGTDVYRLSAEIG